MFAIPPHPFRSTTKLSNPFAPNPLAPQLDPQLLSADIRRSFKSLQYRLHAGKAFYVFSFSFLSFFFLTPWEVVLKIERNNSKRLSFLFLEKKLSQSVRRSVKNYRLGYKRDEVCNSDKWHWILLLLRWHLWWGSNEVFRNIKGIQNMCFLFIYILRPETRMAQSIKKSTNCISQAKYNWKVRRQNLNPRFSHNLKFHDLRPSSNMIEVAKSKRIW